MQQRLSAVPAIRESVAQQRIKSNIPDAEELLHLCDYMIKSGRAKGAIQALLAWRSEAAERDGGAKVQR